jgi:hypothetical protein
MEKHHLLIILLLLFLSTNGTSSPSVSAKAVNEQDEIRIVSWQVVDPLPEEYSVAPVFHGLEVTIEFTCRRDNGCKLSIFDFGLSYEPEEQILPYGSTEPFMDKSIAGIIRGSQTDFPEHINYGETVRGTAMYTVTEAPAYSLVYENTDVDILITSK